MVTNVDGADNAARIIGVALVTPAPTGAAGFYEAIFGWRYLQPGAFHHGDDFVAQTIARAPMGWLPVVFPSDRSRVASNAAGQGGTATAFEPGLDLLVDSLGTQSLLAADHECARGGYAPQGSRPGRVSWVQLNTRDPHRSSRFYSAVFGWGVGESDNEKYTYWRYYRDGLVHAGMMQVDDRSGQDVPCIWQVYFHGPDIERCATQIAATGGRVIVPPTTILGGSFLVAKDPHGNSFGVDHMTHEPIPEVGA